MDENAQLLRDMKGILLIAGADAEYLPTIVEKPVCQLGCAAGQAGFGG